MALLVAAEVDVEIGEGAGVVHFGDLGDVEVGGLEEIELAAEIEVEEALDSAVGGEDAGGDLGGVGFFFHLVPVFVTAAFFGGKRDRKARAT